MAASKVTNLTSFNCEMTQRWIDDAKYLNSTLSSSHSLSQSSSYYPLRNRNVCQLLARREISPRAKCSSKKIWGETAKWRVDCSGPKCDVIDTKHALLSWVEAESLCHLLAKYCPLLPPPRSTIAAAFSSDGKTLASTHGDHTGKIIDCHTGSCLKVLSGHRRTPWVDPGKHQNALNAMASYFGSNLQCWMCGFTGRRKHSKLLMVLQKASVFALLYQRLETLFGASPKILSLNISSFRRKVEKVTSWQEKFILGIGTIFFCVVVSIMLITAPTWALTEDNRLFLEAWRIVDRAYFDKTFNGQSWFRYRENALRTEPMNNREETYMAIRKMLSTLDDPFTRFLEPEKFKSLRSGTQGALTGVGLSIGYPTGLDISSTRVVVISASPGGPANKVGIKPGDVILAIDDRNTEYMDIYEAAQLLQGTEGSTVKLDIRSGSEIKHMVLRREKITLNPVKLRLCDVPGHGNDSSRIGYIKLTSFNQNSSGAVRDAIVSLRGSGVKLFVLDLRDNSGGLFAEGIETAKIWLEKGVIVYICDSRGVRDIYETDGSNAIAASEPLIVLVNRGTASASEILAGALKDNRRAVLYGEPTFGKGKIQSVFELSDGSGLAVTVARYETPGHTDIDKVGIIPDHTLPQSFPLDEDSFCGCLKDPASACNLDIVALFSW